MESLATQLDLSGDPEQALRRTYGARPREAFVRDAWDVLRNDWLFHDDASRNWIVEQLQNLGLGATTNDTSTQAGQIAYLRSCRNARSLRTIVLSEFWYLGEEGLPAQQSPEVPDPDTAPEALDSWLARQLADDLSGQILLRDAVGNPQVPWGDVVVSARVLPERRAVLQLYTKVLESLEEPGSEQTICEVLNELNFYVHCAKFVLTQRGEILLLAELPYEPDVWSAELLRFALTQLQEGTHFSSVVLSQRFGGIGPNEYAWEDAFHA